jgi:hypothetical protein
MVELSRSWLLKSVLALTFMSANLALAKPDGPGGTGGGNIVNDTLASPDEIKIAVEKAKPRLILLFKSVQHEPYRFDQKWRFAYIKMFKDDPDFPSAGNPDAMDLPQLVAKFPIYREIQAAQFIYEPVKACRDKDGTDKDAAVIDVAQHQICISLARLSKTVTLARLYDKVYSLLAHEVSHLTGTSENEAGFVQKLFSNVGEEKVKPMSISDGVNKLYDAVTWWKVNLEKIFYVDRFGKTTSFHERCIELGELNGRLTETIFALEALLDVSGTQVFSVAEQGAFQGLMVKTYMLKQYCLEEDSFTKKYWRDYEFQGKGSVAAGAFARWMYIDISTFRGGDVAGDGMVNYIRFQDERQARKDVADVMKGVEAVLRKLLDSDYRWER